jgi:hypothetical protein
MSMKITDPMSLHSHVSRKWDDITVKQFSPSVAQRTGERQAEDTAEDKPPSEHPSVEYPLAIFLMPIIPSFWFVANTIVQMWNARSHVSQLVFKNKLTSAPNMHTVSKIIFLYLYESSDDTPSVPI